MEPSSGVGEQRPLEQSETGMQRGAGAFPQRPPSHSVEPEFYTPPPPPPGRNNALIAVIGAGVVVVAIGVGWSIFGPETAPAQPPPRPAPNFMSEQTQLMREAVQMAREAHEMQKQHMENMQRMMEEAEGAPPVNGGDW